MEYLTLYSAPGDKLYAYGPSGTCAKQLGMTSVEFDHFRENVERKRFPYRLFVERVSNDGTIAPSGIYGIEQGRRWSEKTYFMLASFIRAYVIGMNDTDIARVTGYKRDQVFRWRTRFGLPSHRYAAPKNSQGKIIDYGAAKEILARGGSNAEAAKAAGCSIFTLQNWKASHGMTHQKRVDYKQMADHYEYGLSDRDIAEEMGVVPSTVIKWRKEHGLPANRYY